ncbi:MAG: DUF1295 domain-containing protein [Actinomycetota bacterium]|nr:DUF1295 domain-containing protein [Actinomycetota bacterium]MEC9394702.1 DUF1295 domain-containing protein [Actinomycetota bacterium]MED6328536.1 DUF1295 domain-containing protein [Actinomycetota bacterium]MEE2958099.1 DUF1295 domain-containing protein [Actinomycetota bacterium]
MSTRTAAGSILIALFLGCGMAVAGSSGGVEAFGLPVFAWATIAIFAVQWVAFTIAWSIRSERFFDLTGSLTFLGAVGLCLALAESPGGHSFLVAALVSVWALRLGTFLTRRVRIVGSDSRFAVMKHRFTWFLFTWTTQGLWVQMTAGAALAAITMEGRTSFGPTDVIGIALWVVGFGTEVVADEQKRRFRADPGNEGRFIATGLWGWSRHPNYVGEILLWSGIAVLAAPALGGWSFLTLLSPFFVWTLLTRVSGVPLLESAADRRWGDRADYRAYKADTPVLWPRLRGKQLVD